MSCRIQPDKSQEITYMAHIHAGLNPNCKLVSLRVCSFGNYVFGVQGAVV